MMELKEFVRQALADVADGVKAAREHLGADAAIGTTDGTAIPHPPGQSIIVDYAGRMYSVIEFDVAVTTTDGANVGAGISVLPFRVGGKLENQTETASRIKFALTLRMD